MRSLKFAALIAASWLVMPTQAQQLSGESSLLPEANYSNSEVTVEQVLGYPMGTKITSPADMSRYFEALQQAYPKQVKLLEYGKSWEGRTLYYAVISSEGNMADFDGFMKGMQALADPRKTDSDKAEQLIDELPGSIWLSYGVHGNEISSPEAAMVTAYHLLHDQREQTQRWLDNTMVFIDPLQNPDGRARFVDRYYMSVGLEHSGDRRSAEHNEPWPNGRTNHYLFDMNRDWIALTQPEISGQIDALLKYYPLVFVDLHEMGGDSTYYFTPEARPYNPLITESQRETLNWIGKNNGQWFDEKGFDYFTREIFDAFYPGYGASWPLYQGSVAMTYEMASARGHFFDRTDGDVLTYADGVQQHFIASISTIQTVSERREALLQKFWEYRKSAVEAGEDGDVRSIILPAKDAPAAARKLASLLVEQGAEVKQAKKAFDVCGTDYEAGAYTIDMAQPAHRMIRTLMDKQVDMADDFLAEQEQRRNNNLPDQIYDVTGWSLPLMFNVDSHTCDDLPDVATAFVEEGRIEPGKVINPDAKVAFLVRWGDMNAGRFLTAALREGLEVRQSELAFTHESAGEFPSGSLILTRADNPGGLQTKLQKLAEASGATVEGVDTSWMTEGPNFGSHNVSKLEAPNIAIAWDEPASPYSAGHTRFVIERQMGYPVTAIRTMQLLQNDLDGLDVLILPEGAYSGVLNDKTVEKIQQWVSDGGVLLTLGSASAWAVETGLLNTQLERKVPEEGVTEPDEEIKVDGKVIESREQFLTEIKPHGADPDWVPGALLNAKVDTKHWLSAGVKPQVVSIYNGNDVFTPIDIDHGRNIAWFAGADSLLASGFLWDDIAQQLPYKPLLMWQPSGKGMIISFTQEPTYRAYMDGLNTLLMNALFLAPAKAQ
ncbi:MULTISPECIES: M14 family zinc carboxypeptidase [unclassified Idiomarina]|uniref:M14 family zinc carboxypeptidase n=1 Tax=unclassified Idiomarina TaxID=2614829 RepID=UPI00257E3B27|nr:MULTISPECIES: M14 family zinc carboxypeptidase [unclassified Idiomarina]|tara:strand:- start:6059 stop:8722 length:2664 start_codon:yes stop_codon:yes gene_type:complete